MSQGFLSGVRVVELGQYIPSPYACQMLADLGAEVVKVEPPGGEPMRHFGKPGTDGIGAAYKALNGNKSIVELDLKSDDGKATLDGLLREADVLVESFRPGVMGRLGFAIADLRERFPNLVIASLSGFGQTGPNAQRAGHDLTYLALSGTLSTTGTVESPVIPIPPIADYAGAMQAAFTVVAALLGRGVTGKGAHLDIAISDAVLAWQSVSLCAEGDPDSVARGVAEESGGAACYQIYRTQDHRFVSLAAQEKKFWRAFCEAVGQDDWIGRQSEPLPQTALIEELAEMFSRHPLAYWRELLGAVDCCFEPVWTVDEISGLGHVSERGLFYDPSWPEPVPQILFPAWIDGRPPAQRKEPQFLTAAELARSWGRN